MHEQEQLLGRHLALGHDRCQFADPGTARVEPALNDRVAQQPRREVAKAHAIIGIQPARTARQRKRRDCVGDDDVSAVGQQIGNVPPQIEIDPGVGDAVFAVHIHAYLPHSVTPVGPMAATPLGRKS